MDIKSLNKEELIQLQKNVIDEINLKNTAENRMYLLEMAKKELGQVTESIFKRSIKLNDFIYVKVDEYKKCYIICVHNNETVLDISVLGWLNKLMIATEALKTIGVLPSKISRCIINHANIWVSWTDHWSYSIQVTDELSIGETTHSFAIKLELSNPKLFELVNEKYQLLKKAGDAMDRIRVYGSKYIEYISNLPL